LNKRYWFFMNNLIYLWYFLNMIYNFSCILYFYLSNKYIISFINSN
jgi:hypothetical protein